MITEILTIEGMNSATCIQAVKEALLSQGAIIRKVEIGAVEIQYDENEVKRQDILMAIQEAGYQAENYNSDQQIIS